MSYDSAIETIIDLCTTEAIVETAYELAATFDDGDAFNLNTASDIEKQLWKAIKEGAEYGGYQGLDIVDNAIAETEFSEED